MSVEYFSGANFPINFMELIRITWHLHLPLPSSRHHHLAKPGQRVPFGREMAVPGRPNEEQHQSREGRGGGGPKPQRPHGLVFEVDQNRVGKQRPEIQGQVEVAEEGHLRVALLRVILVELVGPERRHVSCSNYMTSKVESGQWKVKKESNIIAHSSKLNSCTAMAVFHIPVVAAAFQHTHERPDNGGKVVLIACPRSVTSLTADDLARGKYSGSRELTDTLDASPSLSMILWASVSIPSFEGRGACHIECGCHSRASRPAPPPLPYQPDIAEKICEKSRSQTMLPLLLIMLRERPLPALTTIITRFGEG
nr:Os04g0597816 [Ipomoea batatas]